MVTGCGTSEHGALAVAEILREAARAAGFMVPSVRAEQAFELSLAPPARGLVIGDLARRGDGRHERGAAGRACRRSARPPSITVSGRSPAGALADIVVETGELDQGWCHTVGYLSPILAGATVGAHLSGRELDVGAVVGLLAAGAPTSRRRADRGGRSPMPRTSSSIASGPTGRPAASSCSRSRRRRGCRRPSATSRRSCTATCRRPDPRPASILILTDRDRRDERVARARQALAAARVIGLRTAAIVAADLDAALDPGLTPAGRLVVPESPASRHRSRRSSARRRHSSS